MNENLFGSAPDPLFIDCFRFEFNRRTQLQQIRDTLSWSLYGSSEYDAQVWSDIGICSHRK